MKLGSLQQWNSKFTIPPVLAIKLVLLQPAPENFYIFIAPRQECPPVHQWLFKTVTRAAHWRFEIAWLWVLTWFRSVSCWAHKNNWFAHFSPLWSSAYVCVCVFVRDREAKGGVVALKPTTYISGARRHKTNLCLFSTYLQKQKGTGSHAACFTALQIAYNNNTQHQVYIHTTASETP